LPSDILLIRVSIFPLIGLTVTSERFRITCTARRKELVPTIAPDFIVFKVVPSEEIKISFATSLFGMQAKSKFSSILDGTSFRLWIAKSI